MTNHLVRKAVEIPGSQYVYVVPQFGLGMRSFWQAMEKLTRDLPEGMVTQNKQDKCWSFSNGSKVWMVSADGETGDSIRGVHPHGMVVDEAQMLNVDLWQGVLRPTLNNHRGWAIILGTPNGKDNLLYWAYDNGNNPEMTDWSQFTYDIYRTKFISDHEVAELRKELDEDKFQQEFMCSFVKSVNEVVFRHFDPSIHVQTGVEDDDKSPVLVGMDFNVNPMSAVCAVQHGEQLRIFAEIVLPNSHTGDMVEELLNRFQGRRVQIYPDQSGRSNKTSAVGETDFTLLKRAGFFVYENRSGNPPVSESVKTVNMMLKPKEGEPKILISRSCKTLIDSIDRLRYKPGTSIIDKTKGADHMTDALRYLITYMSPYTMKRRATVEGFTI